jgi:hypothetical protein
MRAILRGVAGDNRSLRGLTGQGEPGLWTLLGGTNAELDAGGRRLNGGKAQIGASARDRIAAGSQPGGVGGIGHVSLDPDQLRDWEDRWRRER